MSARSIAGQAKAEEQASANHKALALHGSEQRRYSIERGLRGLTNYGPWRIYFDPPPIPARNCDWHFYHEDFDGAPDANDNRYGSCGSFVDALNECDAIDDEADQVEREDQRRAAA